METRRVIVGAEPFVFAVFSDTHGRAQLLPGCAERLSASAVIHLGDHARDAEILAPPIYRVRGNCDAASDYFSELLLEIGGKRIFLTHGHHFGVKLGPERLIERAKGLGASFALYGHTHVADIYDAGGVIAANPGSLTQPRSHVQGPCFGKLVYENATLRFEVVRIGPAWLRSSRGELYPFGAPSGRFHR